MQNGIHDLPLQILNGHVFVRIGEALWLLDTGAPNSFGLTRSLVLGNEVFNLNTNYLGLTANTLSQYVGITCSGLIGMDILSRFDCLFDAISVKFTFAAGEIIRSSQNIGLDVFMGIPIIEARIEGRDYRMFFDTGAQISYLQCDSLTDFPTAGVVTDFYPGVGQFDTDIHNVSVSIGENIFNLRCGVLPGLLGMSLKMASVQGIIGNAILCDRIIGFFPRRKTIVL